MARTKRCDTQRPEHNMLNNNIDNDNNKNSIIYYTLPGGWYIKGIEKKS